MLLIAFSIKSQLNMYTKYGNWVYNLSIIQREGITSINYEESLVIESLRSVFSSLQQTACHSIASRNQPYPT